MRSALAAVACTCWSGAGCAVLGLAVPCVDDSHCTAAQPFCAEGFCTAVAPAEGEGEGEGEGEPATSCGVEVPAETAGAVVAVVNPGLSDPLADGCHLSLTAAVAAASAAGGGTVFVGAGIFREDWPLDVPGNVSIIGAGARSVTLNVDTEGSVLILAGGASISGMEIVRTGGQGPSPLVDIRGAALLQDLELRDSQVLVTTAGENVLFLRVLFDGAIVGSLIADVDRSVTLQGCTIEGGELLLDGAGTIAIRDSEFHAVDGADVRSIASGSVTIERTELSAVNAVDHLLAIERGTAMVRDSTFRAPVAATALVIVGSAVTMLDLGTEADGGSNTFSAAGGRADLAVGMEQGIARAVGNTWSANPPSCGEQVRLTSALSPPITLAQDQTCEPFVWLCELDVPAYREHQFQFVVKLGAIAPPCFSTLAEAVTAIGGGSDVGIYLNSDTFPTPPLDLGVSGLLIEGAPGATLTTLSQSLFQIEQRTILRGLTLNAANATGRSLVEINASVVLDGCTLTTDGIALEVPSGGGRHIEVSDSHLSAVDVTGATDAVLAVIDDSDTFQLRDSIIERGSVTLTGSGGAELSGNSFVVSDTDKISLGSSGAVFFNGNDLAMVDGASTCRSGVSLQRGTVALRRNNFGVSPSEPLLCAAVDVIDSGALHVDLGTGGIDDGLNGIFGNPDLHVALDDAGSSMAISAIGNVWSRDPPQCGVDAVDDDIFVEAAASVIFTSNADSCP